MRVSGGVSSRSAANRAAGPRAAAAAPGWRQARREAITIGGVVVGFVMSVVSGFGPRRHVRRVQPLLALGRDGVTQGLRLGRLLLARRQHVPDPPVIVAPALLVVDVRRAAVPDRVAF